MGITVDGSGQFPQNSVTGLSIVDGSVTTDDLQDLTVDTIDIADGAVTLPKQNNEYSYQQVDLSLGTSLGAGSPQEHQRLTTPSLPAGDYLVEWQIAWRCTNTNGLIHADIHLDPDGADVLLDESNMAPSSNLTTDRYPGGGFIEVTLTAGVHEFSIEFYKESGSGSVYIERSRIMLRRVA